MYTESVGDFSKFLSAFSYSQIMQSSLIDVGGTSGDAITDTI